MRAGAACALSAAASRHVVFSSEANRRRAMRRDASQGLSVMPLIVVVE